MAETALQFPERPGGPRLRRSPWSRFGYGLSHAAGAAAGLAMCLRGTRGTPWWLLLALAVPLAGFLLVPPYRRGVLGWLRRLWASMEAYPVQTPRPPWFAVFAFVMAPAAVLMLGREFAICSGDSFPVILTAARLTTSGDCDLKEYADACRRRRLFTAGDAPPYCLLIRGGGVYSAYPSGMVPLTLPTTAAARALGADLHDIDVLMRLDHWTAAWVSAACLGVFFLLALHLVRPAAAWTGCLLLATGSVMFSTVGQTLWQHDGVLFWGLTALLVEFRRSRRLTLTGAALQGVALAMMLACRLTAVAFVVPFGAWMLGRSPRHALHVAAFAVTAFLPWAWLYHSLYGSPLGPSLASQGPASNWTLAGAPAGAAGVLVSPARGLLVYQPWLLLGLFAWAPAVRRAADASGRSATPPGWRIFVGCFLITHLALISAWRCWWGGHCWGSRLATEMIPFAALLCVRPLAALGAMTWGRRLIAAAVVVGCLLHLPAVYLKQCSWGADADVNRRPDMLWCWSDPPFAHAFLRPRTAGK